MNGRRDERAARAAQPASWGAPLRPSSGRRSRTPERGPITVDPVAQTAGRSEAVDCPKCRRYASARIKGYVWYPDFDWQVLLTQCSQCLEAVVVGQSVYPPDEVGPTHRLWPEPARQLPSDAPSGIRSDFEEAERCFARGDYTASAIMTRRLLEGVANELGAKGRSLATKLEDLNRRDEITGMLFDWATELRFTGNAAAHATSRGTDRRDAEDALIFAEALAEHVFTLKKKFAEFKARRTPDPL